MTKVRQDAWSHEDDLLLAETVLRHIREGSTQLDAFEEVGDRLNRTGAACGFRWNAIVRRKYDSAIEIAKKQRKQRKRAEQQTVRNWQTATEDQYVPQSQSLPRQSQSLPRQSQSLPQREIVEPEEQVVQEVNASLLPNKVESAPTEMSMNQVITFLQNLQRNGRSSHRLEKENKTLFTQNESLQKRIVELEKSLDKVKREHQTIEEDYQSLINIMDRARRMVILQDNDDAASPTFKMDKNGNLEKVAK